jgi:hypothetical protein
MLRWAPDTGLRSRSLRHRIAPGTGRFRRSAERIPFGQSCPDVFAGRLRFGAERSEIDAWNPPPLHDDFATDDDGVDIIADATFDDAFHRTAHRPVTQAITAGKIDNDRVGKRAWRKPPEIVAAGAEQRRIDNPRRAKSVPPLPNRKFTPREARSARYAGNRLHGLLHRCSAAYRDADCR